MALSLIALVSLSHSSRLSEDRDEGKPKSLFTLLADFLHWMSWFVKNIAHFIYVVINTMILTVTQIVSTVVSIPQGVINMIEMVGYSVRFALQANYNFVSSSFAVIGRFLESCCVFLKDITISIFTSIKSLFKMILHFLHNVMFGFPKLFGYAESGVQTSANVVGAIAVKTNTSFRGVLSSFGAVLELFGRSIVTTFLLIIDFVTYVLLSCARFFQFIGRSIINLMASAYRGTIVLCKRTGAAVKSSTYYIIDYVAYVLESIKKFFQLVFSTVAMGLLSMFQTVGLVVIQASLTIFGGIKSIFFTISHAFSKTYTRAGKMAFAVFQTIKESDLYSMPYMYGSALLVLALCLLCLIQKINLLNAAFVYMETIIQGMIMKILMLTQKEPITTQEHWSHDGTAGTSHGDVENLQKQLQRERDKNLCVVCQDEFKKVLLLPCRHMCICLGCANYITSSFQRNRRVCPLCRSHITSTVEVYS